MDIRKFGGQTRTLSSAANEPNNDPEATEVSGSGDVLSNSGEGFSLLSSRLLSTDSISVESCLDSSTLTCVGTASLPSDLATPLNDIDKWEIVIRAPSQPSNCHFPRRKYSNGNLSCNPTWYDLKYCKFISGWLNYPKY